MSIEKITKENIKEIFEKMFTLSRGVQTDESKQLLNEYIEYFISIDDHFVHKPIIEVVKGATFNLAAAKIDERAVIYKENGGYNYLYYRDMEGNNYYNINDVNEKFSDYYLLSPSKHNACHWHYNEELDVLMGTNYFVANNEGVFKYEASKTRTFILRGKEMYTVSKTSYCQISTDAYYAHLNDRNVDESYTNQFLLREFTKMFKQPIMNIGANNFLCIDTFSALQSFLSYTAKLEIKNGPKQQKINDLTAIKLPDIKCEIPEKFKGETASTPYSKTTIEKIKDGTCVVRWQLCATNSDVSCDGLRIYIEGKDIHACKLNNANEFVRTTISNIKPENFLSCNMEDVNSDDLKGTILQYYGEVLKEIPEKYRSLLLILFIKEPKLEQIFKMGFGKIIIQCLDEQQYKVLDRVCSILGIPYNKSEKNIFKYLGINKHQLAKFKTLIDDNTSTIAQSDRNSFIRYLKYVLGEDLSAIDNKSFDNVFDALIEGKKKYLSNYYRNNFDWFVGTIKNIRERISSTENKNLIKRFNEILPDICKLGYDNARLYSDYISMVSRMDDFKNFKIGYTCESEIREMHDAANAIYSLKREEYRSKEFKRQLVKVEKLEYENKDDEFCVVIPTEPGDLAKEGLELRHCVKSYIEKVANGSTNIVFIRKKSDKTKPFFTVEVSNDKVIEQVHGFGNRNVDTEPNLLEFVTRWARNKRLNISNLNKIR